jgi:hypothetical protein
METGSLLPFDESVFRDSAIGLSAPSKSGPSGNHRPQEHCCKGGGAFGAPPGKIEPMAAVEHDGKSAGGNAQRCINDLMSENVEKACVFIESAEAHFELTALRTLEKLP